MIWKILSVLLLTAPAATFLLGLLCWRYPPQGPTWAFGYRSRRARASDASWLYAQAMAGRIWFCLGLVLLLIYMPRLSGLKELALEEQIRTVVSCVIVQDVLILLSMVPTEILLLKNFDRFGRPRRRARLQPADSVPAEPEQIETEPEVVEQFESLPEGFFELPGIDINEDIES